VLATRRVRGPSGYFRIADDLDMTSQCGDSQLMSEPEPPEAAAPVDTSADDEPQWLTTTNTVGVSLSLVGLAGVTLFSVWISSLLFGLSVAVFVLGVVLQGVVGLDRRWRREYGPPA
jgi:hypothetical protein